MKNVSSKKAKKLIEGNLELIEEFKEKMNLEPNKLKRNLIRNQIANRETINKTLEKFVK